MPSGKFTYTNKRQHLLNIMIEPWGEDYWIPPGETFEFLPESAKDDFFFEVTDHGSYIAVYFDGDCSYTAVYHAGRKLECGHNRPPDAFKA